MTASVSKGVVRVAVLSAVNWATAIRTPVFFFVLLNRPAVQGSPRVGTMASRLPRCFAAAAATASAAAAAAPGTSAGNPNTRQASSRRRCNAQGEEQEQTQARIDGLHTTSAQKVGCASSSASHHRSGGNNVGPSIDALRPVSPSWKEAIASVRLGRVAYADAAADVAPHFPMEGGEGGGAGGDTMMPSLEEGEKPEFIQRADAQV